MKSFLAKVVQFTLCLLLLIPSLASAAAPGPSADSTANLRSTLGKLFGEYAVLAAISMQKGYDGTADFGNASAALLTNSDELSDAIAAVYGEDVGNAFQPVWNSHIGYLMDFVKATAANDEPARTKSDALLDNSRLQLARFFVDANPNLKENEVAEAFSMHITYLIDAFNAYVSKNYTEVYTNTRLAYGQMFMTADGITAGIATQFPDKYPLANGLTQASELRSNFERTLGEHALLTVLMMQKGYETAPDFNAASAALLQNTNDLTANVASVYGQSTADTFKLLWNSQIAFFVDYVRAAAAKDEGNRQAALANLENYRMKQAKFFAEANPNYREADIAAGLKLNIDKLLSAFHAYSNADYTMAYRNLNDAYGQMIPTGTGLAAGMVAQFPDKFGGSFDPIPPTPTPSRTIVFKLDSKTYKVNGINMSMDVTPEVENGMANIPLRFFVEAMGGKVNWDLKDPSATSITVEDNTIIFWINNNIMSFNGISQDLGSAVHLYGGRMVVPAQFLADMLGWKLDWHAAEKTLTFWK